MSGARFILSLDCEGKWGVADCLTAAHTQLLSDDKLRSAYWSIRALLDEFAIPATFAVVGLFAAGADRLARLPHREIARRLPYTARVMDELAAGRFDGWSAPWLHDLISVNDEWACHGVTHSPFDQLSLEQLDYEFSLADGELGRTIVFPRNRVAHVDQLGRWGFIGYRSARERSRLMNLVAETWPFTGADRDPIVTTGVITIPAGHFINRRSGPRKAVPRELSRLRADHIFRDAVSKGGVVHFWTHPENIAEAPRTLDNLRDILALAASYRDRGEIELLTQRDYVQRLNH